MAPTNEVVVVHVKRSQWLRGEGGVKSYLKRAKDGKMCCIGFACERAGIDLDAYIRGEKRASEGQWVPKSVGDLLAEDREKFYEMFGLRFTSALSEAYRMNDNVTMEGSDPIREQQLKDIVQHPESKLRFEFVD